MANKKSALSYFHSSFAVSVIGLAAGALVGYIYTPTWQGAATGLFLTFILSVLEVSLSFDNAVVNASVLRHMTPIWRQRFITWGILIAVFGMRIVFPLVIVSIMAQVDPWSALVMAATEPHRYAQVMMSAHVGLAGFGGSFLLLVCLHYFFDEDKSDHWFAFIERPLVAMGKISAVQTGLALLVAYSVSLYLPAAEQLRFVVSCIFGIITFICVDGVSALLKVPEGAAKDLHKASAAMFVYLEILDASFSFDGVIGAFALSNNLFLIAAGLGVGAMFVRSLTIMLVEKGTLETFRYLEHGAFYAIGALALVMFANLFIHIPEAFTGLIGAFIIGVSILSSLSRRPTSAKGKAHV